MNYQLKRLEIGCNTKPDMPYTQPTNSPTSATKYKANGPQVQCNMNPAIHTAMSMNTVDVDIWCCSC